MESKANKTKILLCPPKMGSDSGSSLWPAGILATSEFFADLFTGGGRVVRERVRVLASVVFFELTCWARCVHGGKNSSS